jgi:uncharacterized membrane protein YdjX (TVP38/TMEM64 family)
MTPAPAKSTTTRVLRPLLIVVALIAMITVGRQAAAVVPRATAAIADLGAWGPIVFIAVYALACVALVPASLLTLGAGAIFGVVAGTAYVMIGATTGAMLAFLIARYLARDAVANRVARDPRFAAIDRGIAAQGRRVAFLLRLSPLIPFNLLNYALGLTKIRFTDALVACLGMIPGTLLYVYSGHVAGTVAAASAGAVPSRGPAQYFVLGVGLIATAAVTILITRLARRALAEADTTSPA